jgi:hypothetical protein
MAAFLRLARRPTTFVAELDRECQQADSARAFRSTSLCNLSNTNAQTHTNHVLAPDTHTNHVLAPDIDIGEREFHAAVRLQSIIRMYFVREWHMRDVRAAVVAQKVYRGWLARKAYRLIVRIRF